MKAATLLPLLFFVLFAFHGKTSEVRCNGPSLYNEGFCVCKWSCIGNQCQSGKSSKTGLRVRGYRLEACPECHCTEGSTTTSARKPRVLYMTVATHEEPFFELLQSSVSQLGKKLHMFGKGEFFKGYGWKLQAALRGLQAQRGLYDIVLFSDSFDSFVLGAEDEIIEKFKNFGHPMVVSGEVNCWPQPELSDLLPPVERGGRYRFPNSGGYIAEIPYLIWVLTEVVKIQYKSDCTDDQGELIKALARNNSLFKVDQKAEIFQTLFGWAKDDVEGRPDGRVYNLATQTKPCVLHANGWDKEPLIDLLADAGRIDDAESALLASRKNQLEKKQILQDREDEVDERCLNVNPNPALFPDSNIIKQEHLLGEQKFLRKQLQGQGRDWYEIEQMIFEIQEYRAFCPGLPPQPRKVDPRLEKHGVFVYPSSNRSWAAASVPYQALLFTARASPYITENPDEATVMIPDIDVSCWCESCLAGTGELEEGMQQKSMEITSAMENLQYWDKGRRHLIFEYSDAHCSPYKIANAAVAKTGLSTHHERPFHDISMPLFSLVEFTKKQRRVPPAKRQFLLSFKGTRSPRSDAVRKFASKLDDGRDVLILVACRWFGPDNPGYDENCKLEEKRFSRFTFRQLAVNSTFSLIIEGFGYHSFRLNEVLGAGSIPVIVVDHYALPFNTLLDWENFSIRVPEYKLAEVPTILRQIPAQRIREMQKRAVFVYEHFFASMQLQVMTALEVARLNSLPKTSFAKQRAKLLAKGLPYMDELDPWHLKTRPEVFEEAQWCNTPEHRQAEFFA